jgi:hypothetical protein
MNKIICVLLLACCGYVFAEDTAKPLDVNPELENINISKRQSKKEKPDLLLLKPSRLTVLFTASQSNFKQSGTGQTYDTESGSGQGLWASFERELESERLFNIRAWSQKTTFAEPKNIGGRDVNVTRHWLNSSYGWQTKVSNHTFVGELGGSLLSQDPATFSVGESLVPSYFAVGPSLGGSWFWKMSESWGMRTFAGITVPLYFQENGDNSGSHQVSGQYIASLMLEARLNSSLFLTFGVVSEGEQHRFDGDGDRGVEDANVSYTGLALPLGVRYAF